MGNVFADFLQKASVYDNIVITENNYEELYDIIDGKVRISEYCPKCQEKRVFSIDPMTVSVLTDDKDAKGFVLGEILRHNDTRRRLQGNPWKWNFEVDKVTRVLLFSFCCAMDSRHHLDYIVLNVNNKLLKIGQYPSLADLTFPQLEEFKNVIDKESLAEFRRAIGLFSHGIGVGSYVYLRRIFERIIIEAKKEADNKGEVLSGFDTLTMSDKIKALKDYLPDMITSNAVIYSIVSKGIHELSEDECKQYFPVMKESIFLILKKWAQRKKEIEAERLLTKAINDINSEIAQKD